MLVIGGEAKILLGKELKFELWFKTMISAYSEKGWQIIERWGEDTFLEVSLVFFKVCRIF